MPKKIFENHCICRTIFMQAQISQTEIVTITYRIQRVWNNFMLFRIGTPTRATFCIRYGTRSNIWNQFSWNSDWLSKQPGPQILFETDQRSNYDIMSILKLCSQWCDNFNIRNIRIQRHSRFNVLNWTEQSWIRIPSHEKTLKFYNFKNKKFSHGHNNSRGAPWKMTTIWS